MIEVTVARPWIDVRFAAPQHVLSWTLNRPGLVRSDRLLWREVRDADLHADFDVAAWLEAELAARDAREVPCFLTSRDVRRVVRRDVRVEGQEVTCLATVGLSNAERIGTRLPVAAAMAGTINVLVATLTGLTEAARLEALAMAAQARTVAVLEAGIVLPTGLATGTGTDCIAVVAPEGGTAFAGLHTALGEAIGGAVLGAVREGIETWQAETAAAEGTA